MLQACLGDHFEFQAAQLLAIGRLEEMCPQSGGAKWFMLAEGGPGELHEAEERLQAAGVAGVSDTPRAGPTAAASRCARHPPRRTEGRARGAWPGRSSCTLQRARTAVWLCTWMAAAGGGAAPAATERLPAGHSRSAMTSLKRWSEPSVPAWQQREGAAKVSGAWARQPCQWCSFGAETHWASAGGHGCAIAAVVRSEKLVRGRVLAMQLCSLVRCATSSGGGLQCDKIAQAAARCRPTTPRECALMLQCA